MYLKTPCKILLKRKMKTSMNCLALSATETAITVRYPYGGVIYRDIIPWSNIEFVRTRHRKETISQDESKPQSKEETIIEILPDDDGFLFDEKE